jgi:hypothetical protein
MNLCVSQENYSSSWPITFSLLDLPHSDVIKICPIAQEFENAQWERIVNFGTDVRMNMYVQF